jgi:hypothetical protein
MPSTDTDRSVRVFLDIDGVLNAVTRRPDPRQWPDWREGRAEGFTIRYSPTVGRFFRALAEDPAVGLCWLTTWESRANQYIGPMLGIPELPVAGVRPTYERGSWKLEVVQDWYRRDGLPFVWLDDDLDRLADGEATAWLDSLSGHALGVRTDLSKGLTRRDLDAVSRFIDRHRPPAGPPRGFGAPAARRR